jgi:hypothetical protein
MIDYEQEARYWKERALNPVERLKEIRSEMSINSPKREYYNRVIEDLTAKELEE